MKILLLSLLVISSLTSQSDYNFKTPETWCSDCFLIPDSTSLFQYLSGDFNGDGLDDLMRITQPKLILTRQPGEIPFPGTEPTRRNSNSSVQFATIQIALSDGNKFIQSNVDWALKIPAYVLIRIGNFNGDGKDDIVYFQNNDAFVSLSKGNKFDVPKKWISNFGTIHQNKQVGDFNGDGKDDLVRFTCDNTGDVFVSLSNGNGFGNEILWHSNFCYGYSLTTVGDFNGDKKKDIITIGQGDRCDVFVAFSDGNKFVGDGIKWLDISCSGNKRLFCADFNGDKKDDLVIFEAKNNGDAVIALSKVTNFSQVSIPFNLISSKELQFQTVGRFNDDQFYDIAGIGINDNIKGKTQVSLSTGLFANVHFLSSTIDVAPKYAQGDVLYVLKDSLEVWNIIPDWYGGNTAYKFPSKLSYGEKIEFVEFYDKVDNIVVAPWTENFCPGHSVKYYWTKVKCNILNNYGVKEPIEGYVKSVYISKVSPTFLDNNFEDYVRKNMNVETNSYKNSKELFSTKCRDFCFNFHNNSTLQKDSWMSDFRFDLTKNNVKCGEYKFSYIRNQGRSKFEKDTKFDDVIYEFIKGKYFTSPEELFLIVNKIFKFNNNSWSYIDNKKEFINFLSITNDVAYKVPDGGISVIKRTDARRISISTTENILKFEIEGTASFLGLESDFDCQCYCGGDVIPSNDDDNIEYRIECNAGPTNGVLFRFKFGEDYNDYHMSWKKVMLLSDGEDPPTVWSLEIEDEIRQADNSLWAGQVNNNQDLVFRKKKGPWPFIHMKTVATIPLRDLKLPPGSRLVITWETD